MRYLVMIGLALAVAGGSVAQTTPSEPGGWDVTASSNFTQTQNAYSDNWDGEENGQVVWVANLNAIAGRQLTRRVNTRNTLNLAFGQTHNQDRIADNWSQPQKSTDKIEFESLWRFTYGWWADPFASGRFESQWTDRRNGEFFMINPMRFIESVGMAKTLKNEQTEWITRLGFGLRQRMDRNYLTDEVLMTTESKTISDGGVEVVSEINTPLIQDRLGLTSRFSAFQAMFHSDNDELPGDEWKTVDLSLEATFTANVTKYIMVNLYIQWLYDEEVNAAGRFKETLSLGLTYTLL